MLRQTFMSNRALVGGLQRQTSRLFTCRPPAAFNVLQGHVRTKAAAASAAASAGSAAVSVAAPEVPLSFADRAGLTAADGRLQLKNLTLPELQEFVESIGHDSKRALQLWRAMYGDKQLQRSLEEPDPHAPMSAAFRAAVTRAATLDADLTLQSVSTARDGTHKLVFALGSGSGNVETVLIPMRNRDGSQLRYTACLSSQVGCAMNCQFCYTGRIGLLANLSTAQMVEQLVEARRWLAAYTLQQQQEEEQQQQQQQQLDEQQQPADAVAASSSSSSKRGRAKGSWPQPPPRINNIVFMGMGEPLHNMSALMPALDIICHPQGLALSRSKVIVSTVGLVPQLRQLHASQKAKLAVSLHATTDEVRSWIVPANRKHPLSELIDALRQLYPLPTRPTAGDATQQGGNGGADPKLVSGEGGSVSRRTVRSDDFVVIEYVLLRGVNDSEADAARLLHLLMDVYCMINLIVFNPHEGTLFQRSEDHVVQRFKQLLQEGGKVCTLRMSKGDDEMAACGQLGNPELSPRPAPLLKPPRKLQEVLPGAAAAAESQAALLLQQQMLRQQQASMAAM